MICIFFQKLRDSIVLRDSKKNNFSSKIVRKLLLGFTLIELLVVIVIIGILATISVAQFNKYAKQARDAKRMSDIHAMHMAIELYAADGRGFFEAESGGFDTSKGNFGSITQGGPGMPFEHSDDSLLLDSWATSSDVIDLVELEYLTILPVDPLNDRYYFYAYESLSNGQGGCVGNVCKYQLCTRLEAENTLFCKDSFGVGKRATDFPYASAWLASGN
jgi:prepilin-type N-terminal cleavage/methylation domain-containing protein